MAPPQRFPKRDLYRTLKVETTASLEDIKNAFKALARLTHPDKTRDGNTRENNERFAQIREAYEILSNDDLRAEYDAFRMSASEDYGNGRPQHQRRHPSPPRGTYTGGTYGPGPNPKATPYYEEWEPEPPRHRDPLYTQRVRREDRNIAMRIRLDMGKISRDLGLLKDDFEKVARTLEKWTCSEAEQQYWDGPLGNVIQALDEFEDLYHDLYRAVRAAENGKGSPMEAAYLPTQLGILQSHLTRMIYAVTGALEVIGFISDPQETESQDDLLDDLEAKLRVLGQQLPQPKWRT
ncbi:DnaJ-domain-containing protein [Hypomontagnella submonticulosa]|nr:DnaJ-domain-containing protein [Hypomontagnella submonticulosa]